MAREKMVNAKKHDIQQLRRARGFTLVELLIVLAILASLGALSWPSISRLLDRADHLQVVGNVVSLIQEARQQAIQTSRPHIVRVEQDRTKLTVLQLNYDEVNSDDFVNPQPLDVDQSARIARASRAWPQPTPVVSTTGNVTSGSVSTSRVSGFEEAPEGLSPITDEELPAGFQIGQPEQLEENIGSPEYPLYSKEGDATTLPPERVMRQADHGMDLADRYHVDYQPRKSHAIVFDADGQSTDVELEVRDPRGRVVPLHLHGKTGEIVVGERTVKRLGYEAAETPALDTSDPQAADMEATFRGVALRIPTTARR